MTVNRTINITHHITTNDEKYGNPGLTSTRSSMLMVHIVEDDMAAVVYSMKASERTIAENGYASFQVALAAIPSENVTVLIQIVDSAFEPENEHNFEFASKSMN